MALLVELEVISMRIVAWKEPFTAAQKDVFGSVHKHKKAGHEHQILFWKFALSLPLFLAKNDLKLQDAKQNQQGIQVCNRKIPL